MDQGFFNNGQNDQQHNRPAPDLSKATPAQRDSYYKGKQAGQK